MIIAFDNVNFNSNSGPNTFGQRLAKQFKKMGHKVVFPNQYHDVMLSFICQTNYPAPGAKKVLRLDGIEFKPENFEANNRFIKSAYYSFDHVIIQSEFDKKMIEKHFGTRSDCTVIHNGIELGDIKEKTPHKPDDEVWFICAASWHPQKRLKENIKLFQQIKDQLKERGKIGKLIVLGRNADLSGCDTSDVVCPGQISHKDCLDMYAQCDYMIHLAWLDHCPNVVVEAISQGCPVICTNSGGTHEIVKDNGIIIPETKEYDFRLLDYDLPYEIDLSDFVLPEQRPEVDASYLDIKLVAEKYLEVLGE